MTEQITVNLLLNFRIMESLIARCCRFLLMPEIIGKGCEGESSIQHRNSPGLGIRRLTLQSHPINKTIGNNPIDAVTLSPIKRFSQLNRQTFPRDLTPLRNKNEAANLMISVTFWRCKILHITNSCQRKTAP